MSNPTTTFHGLSVLTHADAAQRLAHPLAATEKFAGLPISRSMINFFNDALTETVTKMPIEWIIEPVTRALIISVTLATK